MHKSFTTLLCLGIISVSIASADEFALTPEETFAMIEEKPGEILFIDVRDPIEIMFVGGTTLVDANTPFLMVDRYRWNPQQNTFLMERNPAFIAQVRAALKDKGLDSNATIITMCRSGSDRGRPSAQFLRDNGFVNALYIDNGFQGTPAEEGPHAGKRIVNGWQNAGLPWQTNLDPSTIFRPQASDSKEWLVILSSSDIETQAMALILATNESAQGTAIRILLCDAAGLLAVKGETTGSEIVKPIGRSPRQMLQGLINNGARVEICAIFLPNRDIHKDSLLEGVQVAHPNSITRAISHPSVITLTF